jgi:hypothetical protein
MLFRVTVGRASFDNEVDEQFRFCGQRAGSRICDLSSSGPTSFRREQPAKDTATSASKTSEMNRWFRNIRVQVYQLLLLPERVIDRVSAGSKSARRELVDGPLGRAFGSRAIWPVGVVTWPRSQSLTCPLPPNLKQYNPGKAGN